MRTNIDIDDELMHRAMKATGATTKKASVEAGLRLVVQLEGQAKLRELSAKSCGADPTMIGSLQTRKF